MKKENFNQTNNVSLQQNLMMQIQNTYKYKVFVQLWPHKKYKYEPSIEISTRFKTKAEALQFIENVYIKRYQDDYEPAPFEDEEDDEFFKSFSVALQEINIDEPMQDYILIITLFKKNKVLKKYIMQVPDDLAELI